MLRDGPPDTLRFFALSRCSVLIPPRGPPELAAIRPDAPQLSAFQRPLLRQFDHYGHAFRRPLAEGKWEVEPFSPFDGFVAKPLPQPTRQGKNKGCEDSKG